MATKKETTPAAPEAVNAYSADELAASAHIFGTMPEVVTAALQEAGITKTTQERAGQIVTAFLKREVK